MGLTAWLLMGLGRCALRLRYRIKVTGIQAVAARGNRGILFLPNHPALIDPVIVISELYGRFAPSSLADKDRISSPMLSWISRRFGALPMPDLGRYGEAGRKDVEQAIQDCARLLAGGGNLVLYPGGHLMSGRMEQLGGNSAVETILKLAPDTRVVLIRTRGLWGSRFSRAQGPPDFFKVLARHGWDLLANFVFFSPRREVTVELGEASGASLRALFRRLKFLRLLHTIGKTDHGHRVVIDGPYSLFESVTKYGLSLALVLPALEACESWKLVADVRWGKERTPLVFRCESPPPDAAARRARPDVPTSDEVSSLVKSFRALGTTWRVSTSTRVLELPGIGLTIPDLVFERDGEGGKSVRVFLEVMGYWSRDAVWKRVELVQAGLPERMLFAVSSRLRVSEEVLPEDLPGALYVYKGTLSARVVAERLEALAARRAEA